MFWCRVTKFVLQFQRDNCLTVKRNKSTRMRWLIKHKIHVYFFRAHWKNGMRVTILLQLKVLSFVLCLRFHLYGLLWRSDPLTNPVCSCSLRLLFDWFQQQAKLSRVIFNLQVRELCALYIYINIFLCSSLSVFCTQLWC